MTHVCRCCILCNVDISLGERFFFFCKQFYLQTDRYLFALQNIPFGLHSIKNRVYFCMGA